MLATSVGYRTMRASASLTAEQQAEADRLGKLAGAAARERKFPEALKQYAHGLAVMRGEQWNPINEFGASVTLKTEHALWEPGQSVRLKLTHVFMPDGVPDATMSAVVRLVQLGGSGEITALEKWDAIDPKSMPWSGEITVPDIAVGNYRVEMQLASIAKTAVVHVEPLLSQVSKIRSRCDLLQTKMNAKSSACYVLERYRRADAGDLAPTVVDFPREIAEAAALLNILEAGKNPYAAKHGDMRKAYISSVDDSQQPYRLFVPTGYDETKPIPLVVALHGMGGDENALFDRYGSSAITQQAEQRGFLVVCPKGREPASMYLGPAEQDVLDVIAQVRQDYRVDPNRIYLMGHSMGAYGTWSIAMAHPEIFAALGPIAGGGNIAGMEKIRQIPQFVVHGDADKTVPVDNSRAMIAEAKKLNVEIKYTEVPGGSHSGVVIPAIPGMFAWFDLHTKKSE